MGSPGRRARAGNISRPPGVTSPRPSPVVALRSVLASVLLAVLAVGGVVLPAVHRAAHGVEVADARAAHAAHHSDAAPDGPLVEAPCPPAPNDVDCAVCLGISVAAEGGAAAPPPETAVEAHQAHADRVRTVAAAGAGARAPPVG